MNFKHQLLQDIVILM